jgi:hypothetical protein
MRQVNSPGLRVFVEIVEIQWCCPIAAGIFVGLSTKLGIGWYERAKCGILAEKEGG